MNLLKIVAEEVVKFINEYFDPEEESLIDKYHAAKGIHTLPPKEQEVDGDYIGSITHTWQVLGDMPLKNPVPVYKNPRNINAFPKETRGILLQNGDVYLANGSDGLHDDILNLLGKKRIVPLAATHNWYTKYPEEFVAIQRVQNFFIGSASYDSFPNIPDQYIEHFDNANRKHPYKFKHT